ncbi:hypothetical protein FRC01_009981, partial [Tulasnella sp. 417]
TLTFISTIGGGRLLLNVRAAYYSTNDARMPGNPKYFDTEGMVGRYHRNYDDDDGDCAASISMGIWSNEGVLQNPPPSPEPVIMLKPILPGRRRFARPPSPSLASSSGGAEGVASSSRLSSSRSSSVPEGEREEHASPEQQPPPQPQRNEPPSTPDMPQPRASTSTTPGTTRRRGEDPDVELGEPIQDG